MGTEATANEALARRWHTDIFDAGNLDAADEILGPGFVFHMPNQDVRGTEEVKQLATLFRTAFPDVRITHEDVIASGNKVAIRWTARGTHQGEYLVVALADPMKSESRPWSVSPTGKTVQLRGIDWYNIANGKIEEAWIEFDEFGLLQQMGAVSPPA